MTTTLLGTPLRLTPNELARALVQIVEETTGQPRVAHVPVSKLEAREILDRIRSLMFRLGAADLGSYEE